MTLQVRDGGKAIGYVRKEGGWWRAYLKAGDRYVGASLTSEGAERVIRKTLAMERGEYRRGSL